MSNGELGSEAIYVVEVAVGRVLVFLIQFCSVELLVVETTGGNWPGALLCGGGVEGASSSGGLGGGGFGSDFGCLVLLGLCKVFCHTSSSKRLGSMRAQLDIGTGGVRENTLVVVETVDLCITSYASISGSDLTGTKLEGRTHNGALGRLLCELGEGRVAVGRGSA